MSLRPIPNETQYNYQDPYNLTAGIMLSMMGVFGILSNASILLIYVTHASERNSFNTICAAKSIANLYNLIAVFGVIFVPTTFYGRTSWLTPQVSTALVCIGLALYAFNENLTLLIAMNRCCAIFFPIHYRKLCGMRPTMTILFCICLFRLVKVATEVYETLSLMCSLYFSPYILTWMLTDPEECDPHTDILMFFGIFVLTTVMNVMTFMKIACFYRKSSQLDKSSRERERKNIRLFFQTVLQDFLYVIDIAFTFKLGYLIDHRLWTFLSGTLIWESLHSIDGYILAIK